MDEPNITSVPPVPPISPSPKNHTLAWILALILVALVSGLAVYFYLSLRTVSSIKPVTLVPTPTVSTVASWQTYKNDQFGFEFRYPDYLKLTSSSTSTTLTSTDYKTITGEMANTTTSGISFKVSVENKTCEAVDTRHGLLVNKGKVGSYDADFVGGTMDLPNEFGFVNVYFNNDCLQFATTDFGPEYRKSQFQLFDQILSTFKFTTPVPVGNSSISDWKTYKNDQYSLEFKYPARFDTNFVEYKKYTTTFSDWINTLENQKPVCSEIGCSKWTYFSKNEITVANNQAAAYESSDTCGRNMTLFADLKNKNLVKITFCLGDPEVPVSDGNKLLFNQILSTFKFTAPTPNTSVSKWQTYVEPVSSYSFQYPSSWTVKITSQITKIGDAYQGVIFLAGPEGDISVYLGGGLGGGLCSSAGGKLIDIAVGNKVQKNCLVKSDNVDVYGATCGDCVGVNSGISIKFDVTTPDATNSNYKIVSKILSTFKFTN